MWFVVFALGSGVESPREGTRVCSRFGHAFPVLQCPEQYCFSWRERLGKESMIPPQIKRYR